MFLLLTVHLYKYIYITETEVNINAQMMAHLHGGATTQIQICTTPFNVIKAAIRWIWNKQVNIKYNIKAESA